MNGWIGVCIALIGRPEDHADVVAACGAPGKLGVEGSTNIPAFSAAVFGVRGVLIISAAVWLTVS